MTRVVPLSSFSMIQAAVGIQLSVAHRESELFKYNVDHKEEGLKDDKTL